MRNVIFIPLLLPLLAPFTTAATFWCGTWAGSPNLRDAPSAGQLPTIDSTRRYFTEPQLQDPPFQPPLGPEPRVQVPKIWGNNGFRLALLSYATTSPATRVFASSKSSWYMIDEAKQNLMENCVSKGSGGAILVPPLPKLRESTLVLYAYVIGSQFDFTMNYYMSKPYGINPATLVNALAVGGLVNSSASANIAATS